MMKETVNSRESFLRLHLSFNSNFLFTVYYYCESDRSSASLPIRYSRARVCVLRNIYESFSEEMAAGNFIIDSLCTGISKNVIQPTKIPFKQDECYCHARLALNVRLVL